MADPKSEAVKIRDQQFKQWLGAFEVTLKNNKPAGLTDHAIDLFCKSIDGEYFKLNLPDSFSFDKLLRLAVTEAAEHCALFVDDFPETEDEKWSLVQIADEVRQEVLPEMEKLFETPDSSQTDELKEVYKTVLEDYDREAPNTPPEIEVSSEETAEHLKWLRESHK